MGQRLASPVLQVNTLHLMGAVVYLVLSVCLQVARHPVVHQFQTVQFVLQATQDLFQILELKAPMGAQSVLPANFLLLELHRALIAFQVLIQHGHHRHMNQQHHALCAHQVLFQTRVEHISALHVMSVLLFLLRDQHHQYPACHVLLEP